MKRMIAVLALAGAVGCAHFHSGSGPTIREEWDATLSDVRQAADSGKYDTADKTLAGFIAQHRGSHEATEALFWRALYKVDPSNKNGSLSAGVSGFDAYLAADSASLHRSVAIVLRRTAALAQSLKLATTTQQNVTTPDKDATKSRDEEIASLRDQLAKVNAELERIKKRLANPKG